MERRSDVDVNSVDEVGDDGGFTALCYAAFYGYADIASLLLETPHVDVKYSLEL